MRRSNSVATRLNNRAVVFALCGLLPALMGGCPEFRNSSVDALDAAARSVLLSDATRVDAADTATTGVLNAALDLLFDQLRTDQFN